MNETFPQTAESWLALVGSPATVLGPSRGHTPDINRYRIASINLSPQSLWLYGAVTDMPEASECNGERSGITKFNLALQISLRELLSFSGQPLLEPELDDSNHGFELALPVAVSIERTTELVWSHADHRVFEVVASSEHLRFHAKAEFIFAHGGKHAPKRYSEACRVRGWYAA